MAIRRKSGGAGERVLEGRHVIGLFVLILLFSGLFFTLGFVMGRNQYDGKVLADHLPKNGIFDPMTAPKPLPGKHPNAASPSAPAPDPANDAKPNNPGWDVHEFDGAKNQNDRLQTPVSDSAPQRNPPAAVRNTAVSVSPHNKLVSAPALPSGAFTLQVAALKSQADALDLAARLQKKKFSAFVLTPQGDRFYRVQVGPYPDQKSADAAKKGLDSAGFKAIVKH
jgi:septal ring-binding cell division protein DamX